MFIGLAYTQQENWAEANESYSMALRAIEENGNGSSPLLSDIYSNKALCASRQGDSEEAHRLCRLAKELAPCDAEPYLLEGRIYMEEDNFSMARAEWALALRYAPEADTWMEIGNYSLEFRMLENARFCFEQVLEEAPEYPKICEQLAAVCLVLQIMKDSRNTTRCPAIPSISTPSGIRYWKWVSTENRCFANWTIF